MKFSKILFAGFYLLLAAVISTAGFLLPPAMSKYQDEQIFSKIEHSPIEPVEFTYSSSPLDTLVLMQSARSLVDYPVTAGIHSQEEIYKIAQKMIRQLQRHGITVFQKEETVLEHSENLRLAIALDTPSQTSSTSGSFQKDPVSVTDIPQDKETYSSKTGLSNDGDEDNSVDITTAIVWECRLYSYWGYSAVFWIDDKTEKLVDLNLYTEQTLRASEGSEEAAAMASAISNFLKDNYQVQAKCSPQAVFQNDAASYYGKLYDGQANKTESNYIIQLKDKSEKLVRIQLSIHGNLEINEAAE